MVLSVSNSLYKKGVLGQACGTVVLQLRCLTGVSVFMSSCPCRHVHLPVSAHPGRQQAMAEVVEPLTAAWETQVGFQVPGFSLAYIQLLWAFAE